MDKITQDKSVHILHKNEEVAVKKNMYRPVALSKKLFPLINDQSVNFTILDTSFTTNFLKR